MQLLLSYLWANKMLQFKKDHSMWWFFILQLYIIYLPDLCITFWSNCCISWTHHNLLNCNILYNMYLRIYNNNTNRNWKIQITKSDISTEIVWEQVCLKNNVTEYHEVYYQKKKKKNIQSKISNSKNDEKYNIYSQS